MNLDLFSPSTDFGAHSKSLFCSGFTSVVDTGGDSRGSLSRSWVWSELSLFGPVLKACTDHFSSHNATQECSNSLKKPPFGASLVAKKSISARFGYDRTS